MSETKSDVVVVTAHPDDEIFCSGTICLCTDNGFRVTLVCVTDGEGGSSELLNAGSGQDLGRIRRQELALSASVLGVSEVLFLSHADIAAPDGGGEGSWDQPKLIAALARIFEENYPKLVLTHGPLGGYGNAAHRLVHSCVMSAARMVPFSGSIFSFCGQVKHAFFSWHFDQRSDVFIDASRFLRRRVASLSYHQSQIGFFLQPYFPHTLRKYLSASFGYVFILSEVGRKRVPIGTATRFFKRFPVEGLTSQKAANVGQTHFFLEHFANDNRVQFNR
jgi:LmbE family N-acetylglucosaminyl deacetylase